ncbi:PTS glucitol/sorbitol transporter subunit IIB [Anaerococcus sp. AGMB00486]|uniref:PTS glucitol/sorbitol transporter subunit IIB n=2 Tax=Anaerococcus TaxID=165779 RepID=A0ABX2NAB8_9FIRM|nr:MULTISPECIES: PTS glucitol/sorbitol transporter subunit IIB [Anaerococcus]MSS77735.1 PTS glucitol/sorbitol transporter subunit IIB [Anaerococcus porci]NVF11590.1 PTS glucitol/sorbitol transporter subunit IIB [Anaerococcus faecalis]
MSEFKTIKIIKGKGGFGGPLELTPTEEKKYVISVTGGGIDPVAQKIADLSGAIAVDQFKNPVDKSETFVAVIDCGGNSRVGTYPRLGIPTVDIKMQGPAGPLAKFITEDIFVSGVTVDDIYISDGSNSENDDNLIHNEKDEDFDTKYKKIKDDQKNKEESKGFIDKIARGASKFTTIFYQSGRETIENVVTNILPFMAFIATIIGIINYTGIGNIIAKALVPLSGNLIGLILVGVIVGLPFLSPLLAPGAVMAAIVGTLIGQQIGTGAIPPSYALPALFAINGQVGCDFIPVGLTLGDADPKTISVATPAVLFSRVITSPLGVLIGFLLSLGM